MFLAVFLGKILSEVLVTVYLGSTAGFLLKNACKMALRREAQMIGNLFIRVF
jgi:hypothetical protein